MEHPLANVFREQYTDEEPIKIGKHALRYALSYEAIQPFLVQGINILEVGGGGAFQDYVRKTNGVQITNTTTDLRYDLPLPSNSFDLVLNMEVLEHIKDQRGSEFHVFNFTGVRKFLSECYRVLKPGGRMFLTTPNAHAMANLIHILELAQPIFFSPHVREYALNDLTGLLTEQKFIVEHFSTCNCWNVLAEDKLEWISSIAKACGSKVEYMNEDIFVLARK